MSDVYVMFTNRIDMAIDKGWYAKYKIQTNSLLLVIWQKYFLTKLEKNKILGQNGFLSVDINLKSNF